MLKQLIKNLPHKPGCYLYKDKNQTIIYVGKANDLYKRVSTYFNRTHDVKTTRLVRDVVSLDFIVVNNEKEALVLEENLIKQYRPKYNILLNDDKAYPYIVITNQTDPEYKYVRKYDKKALRNFGPLPIGSNARNILQTLQQLFPLRRCKGNMDKPCLYYELKQCSGACFQKVDAEYYKNKIKQVDNFFKGDVSEVTTNLENRMQKASGNLQFEEAQRLKNQLNSLSFMISKQVVEFNSTKNIDITSYEIDNERIAFSTLFYRNGILSTATDHIQLYLEESYTVLIDAYLNQLYKKNITPDVIILDSEIELKELNYSIQAKASHAINANYKNLLNLANKNAKEKLLYASNAHNINVANEHQILNSLQTYAKLNVYPARIEMFDISNIGSDFITGACIIYIEGKPIRTEFRRYNIDPIHIGDVPSMRFMVERHFAKEGIILPNLIIVDGGFDQVRGVKDILRKLNLNIDVIGLVKNDFHKTDKMIDTEEQLIDVENIQLFNWLSQMQIRVDEYAKSGFRKRQTKSMLDISLISIQGVGKKTVQELLKAFGTIIEIKQANFNQLNAIVKNAKTTNNILSFYHEKEK